MRTRRAVAWVARATGLAPVLAMVGAAPAAGVPLLARVQPVEAVLYQCVDGTEVDVAIVGLALCDAEPTPPLHERAEPDNLQIRDGALGRRG